MRLPSSILAVNSFAYSTSHRIKVSFVLSSLGFNEPISVDEDMCLQRKVDFFQATIIQLKYQIQHLTQDQG